MLQAPLLQTAGWSALAALAAGIGPLFVRPQSARHGRVLGISCALAAGAMLGVGYASMAIGMARGTVVAAAGAVLGLAGGFATNVWLGVGGADAELRPSVAVFSGALHAAPEGVAMGAAMAVSPKFGLFLIATLAVHNVWEAEVLSYTLVTNGRSRVGAALASAAANIPQVLFAVTGLAIAIAVPGVEAGLLGLSFGAMSYLSIAELLPESYRTTGRTSIAVLVSVAAGIVALLGGTVT